MSSAPALLRTWLARSMGGKSGGYSYYKMRSRAPFPLFIVGSPACQVRVSLPWSNRAKYVVQGLRTRGSGRRWKLEHIHPLASAYWIFSLGDKILNSHFLCYNICNNDLWHPCGGVSGTRVGRVVYIFLKFLPRNFFLWASSKKQQQQKQQQSLFDQQAQ